MKKVFYTLVICLMATLLLTGCGKKGNSVKNDDHLKIEWFEGYDKSEIILEVTNENNYNIGVVDIEYTFRNGNGEELTTNTDSIYDFKAGSKYVASYETLTDDEGNFYIPEKVEIKAEINKSYQEDMGEITSYTDKISSNINRDGDSLNIEFVNNTGEDISELYSMIVFKKDGKPIAARQLVTPAFTSNYSESLIIPVNVDLENETETPIEYDEVEVNINDVVVAANIMVNDEDENIAPE